MLGIRRYQGTQIDLFVGDPETFVCDGRLTVGADQRALARMSDSPRSHLVLLAEDPSAASALMAALKTALDGASQRPRRVTWVLASTAEYVRFQEALFAIFPDEPLGSQGSG